MLTRGEGAGRLAVSRFHRPRWRTAVGIALSVAVGCGGPARPGGVVTVVIAAADASRREIAGALARPGVVPVELRIVDAPTADPPSSPELPDLAAARARYVDAEFGRCLRALDDSPEASVLLIEGSRTAAARTLLWRVACLLGAGRDREAEQAAAAMLAFGLDDATEVDAVSPEVERLVGRVRRRISTQPRARLRVIADVNPARVTLDGRLAVCVTPCTLEVLVGAHVVGLEADGASAGGSVIVDVSAVGASHRFRTSPVSPAVARQQWSARYAGEAPQSPASLALLARAVGSDRLAVLVEPRRGEKLIGGLIAEGAVVSQVGRAVGEPAVLAPILLRDLLIAGKLVDPTPPLHRRPRFWIAIGLALVAATTITAMVLYEPPTRTEVSL